MWMHATEIVNYMFMSLTFYAPPFSNLFIYKLEQAVSFKVKIDNSSCAASTTIYRMYMLKVTMY